MPSAYTHFFIAEKVSDLLPPPLREAALLYPRLFFFGAQGADFCFFYRALHASEINFGRFLHNRGSYDFFRTLSAYAAHSPAAFAYAMGYITHYAADCTFHPYVYYLSGKSPVKHSRTEGALDCYFRKKAASRYCENPPSRNDFSGIFKKENEGDITDITQNITQNGHTMYETNAEKGETEGGKTEAEKEAEVAKTEAEKFRRDGIYFNCAPSGEEADILYAVYALAAANADRFPLLKPAFMRSIHSYLAYVKISARIFAGNAPEAINAEHNTWHYPDDPDIVKTDGAEELFCRAVTESIFLCKEFSDCIKEKRTPSRELFGKNFLSGLSYKK